MSPIFFVLDSGFISTVNCVLSLGWRQFLAAELLCCRGALPTLHVSLFRCLFVHLFASC
uniref:Uncharacterized protein n=1 Tax=Arundo donax TaxID=35708 RepID=A0A0A9HDU6_ARUDO